MSPKHVIVKWDKDFPLIHMCLFINNSEIQVKPSFAFSLVPKNQIDMKPFLPAHIGQF